ncbi:MAG: hypothetical protein MUE85_01635 [Microscillaceae bacterium]|jgi:hypothetical protein|nr:hypothetical protein [Microscillaceae bacterium]
MGYSNYKKLRQVTQKFGLKSELADLFNTFNLVEPSAWLSEALKRAERMPLTNEKNKSERLVSPILLEVVLAFQDKVTLFSGEEINISAQDDLAGSCDFFITLQKPSIIFETPIISLAEAKDEDLEWGIAQCAAQMYGADLYNKQDGKNIAILYGCATTGVEWRFMRLENQIFYINRHSLTDLTQILGVWHWIIQFYLDNYSQQ